MAYDRDLIYPQPLSSMSRPRCCVEMHEPQILSCRIRCAPVDRRVLYRRGPLIGPRGGLGCHGGLPAIQRWTNAHGPRGCIEHFSWRGLAQPFPHQSGMASCSATPRCGSFCEAGYQQTLFSCISPLAEPHCFAGLLRGFLNLRHRKTNPPWPISSHDAKTNFERP